MRLMVLLADTADEGLIGMYFLRAHRMVIDFAANKVKRDGDPVVIRCHEGSD